jgi:hypothetical protein
MVERSDIPDPKVVSGSGHIYLREMLATFEEIEESSGTLSAEASEKIKSGIKEMRAVKPIIQRPYVKTVAGSETGWYCNAIAKEIKQAVQSGNEDEAVKTLEKLQKEVSEFIEIIQSYVIRMT